VVRFTIHPIHQIVSKRNNIMFTEKEHATALGGLTVKEAHIGLQLLDKAAAQGIIQPVEYALLGEWRTMLVDAISRSVNKNYDEELLKIRQAAQKLADEQQAAANEQESEPVEESSQEQETA